MLVGAVMTLDFTAILAHELLADPRHLQGADPEALFKRFFQYNAHRSKKVEIEQKIHDPAYGDREPGMENAQRAVCEDEVLSEYQVEFMCQIDGDIPGLIDACTRE